MKHGIVVTDLRNQAVTAIAMRERGWKATVDEYAHTIEKLRAELATQLSVARDLAALARAEGFKAGAEHESALRAQLADAMQATADAQADVAHSRTELADVEKSESEQLARNAKRRVAMRPVRLDIARGLGAALLARTELDRLWIAVAPAIDALPPVEAAKARAAFCALLSAGLEQSDALGKAVQSDAFDEPLSEWMNSSSMLAMAASVVGGLALVWAMYGRKPATTQAPVAP